MKPWEIAVGSAVILLLSSCASLDRSDASKLADFILTGYVDYVKNDDKLSKEQKELIAEQAYILIEKIKEGKR